MLKNYGSRPWARLRHVRIRILRDSFKNVDCHSYREGLEKRKKCIAQNCAHTQYEVILRVLPYLGINLSLSILLYIPQASKTCRLA